MKALIKHLLNTPFMKRVKQTLESQSTIEITDTFEGLDAALILAVKQLAKRPIVVVHHNLYQAQKLAGALSRLDEGVTFFPQDEFVTTDMLAMSEDLKFERAHTIGEIINGRSDLTVTHPAGFVRTIIPKIRHINARITYKRGEDVDIDAFLKRLVEYGYEAAPTVEKSGDFARRGSVLDLFPADADHPIRIEFFDTEIESIRRFDVNTQRSIALLDSFTLVPRTEFFYDDEDLKRITKRVHDAADKQKLNTDALKRVEAELEDLHNHKNQDSLARYATFLDEPLETISDYYEEPLLVVFNDQKINDAIDHIGDDLGDWLDQAGDYARLGFDFLKDPNHIHRAKTLKLIGLEGKAVAKNPLSVRGTHTPMHEGNLHQLLHDLKKYDKHTTVLIALSDERRLKAFKDQLDDKVDLVLLGKDDDLRQKRINLIHHDMPVTFEWFDANLVVFNDDAIYGDVEKKPRPKYRSVFKDSKKVTHVKQLQKGDLLVHYDHGIGRFIEIRTMTISERTNDYIVIQYRGDDTLYIPVENIHMIQKYVAHEGVRPKLNRLGSADWAKTKARVRKKAGDIADHLINLYAERERIEGFAFSPDSDLTTQFDADFHFEETDDQQKAIDDVKRDMEAPRPMDRLICGDVGYGKTEVALRAAFKAALDNKQTAYLAPTTVLSRQHFQTFKHRLEKHGITVALLNRFVTPAKQKQTLIKLKQGKIDVVLGTHRLLSSDVLFKDLGLLIIDEEQRFGVEHKEKIKALRKHVDVLSLSATPIPRTLQMAITGVKQMSLLETPPKNRHPVQTYVMRRNESVVKDAIERELARGGQVFYLYNRVDTIQTIRRRLERLVPDARIVYAHGKMSRAKLETVMEDFLDHRFDVLVSTTIIETGIDIPNANTLIVHDSDKLGLSQLYQIRGRVGRSDRIAYSYLMYEEHKQLTEEAAKRLEVIKEFTELGSGYKIAMRDLTIRGAGDILGTEQSGFIDSVGIDLFMEMLKEEIERRKTGKVDDRADREKAKQAFKVDVDKTIDSAYIPDDDLRLELHRRIVDLDSSNALILLKEEIEDRFGPCPRGLALYMTEKLYETLALDKGVEQVFDKANTFEWVLSPKASSQINGERLFSQINDISPHIGLRYKRERLHVIFEKHKLNRHVLEAAVEVLEAI